MKFHDTKVITGSLLLLLALACAPMSPAAGERPNILIILMDDFGTGQFQPIARQLELADIDPGLLAYTDALSEAYDKQAALDAARQAMPFMSTLAGQGVLFSRAFSANSLCAPSRQAILTGTNPIRRGGYRNIDVEASGLEGQSLAPHLQDAGYRTGYIGKWHVGEWDPGLLAEIEASGGSAEDAVAGGTPARTCSVMPKRGARSHPAPGPWSRGITSSGSSARWMPASTGQIRKGAPPLFRCTISRTTRLSRSIWPDGSRSASSK